ncbi:phage minor head protein [Rhodospirillum sp. A1_3_36]|uniref:phage head morphogenesis protein n=1 Tax=Rhodospirillum sp. A1_3_36 TaxID=3391666 RepID=UPI0039A40D6C
MTPEVKAPTRPDPAQPWPGLAWSWTDQAKKADGDFQPAKAAERTYAKQLGSVAGRVRQITAGGGDPDQKIRLLRAYAATLNAWAEAAATVMVAAAARKNDQVWRRQSERIGQGLREHLTSSVNGVTLQKLIAVNAGNMKSLASDAADRLAHLTQEALVTGMRPEELAKKIEAAGDATGARARTLARTAVSSANTALTKQRAQGIGGTGYIWRTARDGGVRESHAAMEGKFIEWDHPPTIDGYTAHAGEFANCRCYCEPVVPRPGGGRPIAQPLPTEESTGGKPTFLSHWEKHNKKVVPYEPGQPLPGHGQATADIRKLTEYALNKNPDKARVFASALGMDERHAEDLRAQLLRGLAGARTERGVQDHHGERFVAFVPVQGANGQVVEVRTAWIYDRRDGRQAEAPRLVTAYIDSKRAPKATGGDRVS